MTRPGACSVGEISDAMREVFGDHKPMERVVSGAYASEFAAQVRSMSASYPDLVVS